jgi:hypothetical protein
MDHIATYCRRIDHPYGKHYAACVRKLQAALLKDRACRDLGAAFNRAVETCERNLPAIIVGARVPA